jgi:hypothetical protein
MMAKFCTNCGTQLPLLHKFTRDKLCSECSVAIKTAQRAQGAGVRDSIKAGHAFTQEEFELLRTFDRRIFSDFYQSVCYDFIERDEITEQDFETLFRLQQVRPKDGAVRRAYEDAFAKMGQTQLDSVERSIVATRACTAPQLEVLKTFDHETKVDLYEHLCEDFIANSELGEQDIQTLNAIKQGVELSDQEAHQAQAESVKHRINATRTCTALHVNLLRTFDHETNLDVYTDVRDNLLKRELNERDMQTLRTIQNASRLNEQEIQFEEFVKPYYYVKAIRNEHALPTIDLNIAGVGRPILRRGELMHYGSGAVFHNIKTVANANLGVPGVHYRVNASVNYRAGAHKKFSLTPDSAHLSAGVLVITNKRIFLQPSGGQAPVSINLNNILSFSCWKNGILVWKEGRQRMYFFAISNSGAVEIFALCLIFLLDAESRREYAKNERSQYRSIPTEVKNRVLERDGGRCVMCGSSEGIHFDHILPIARGGDNTEDNIQILCKDCNLRKSDKII